MRIIVPILLACAVSLCSAQSRYASPVDGELILSGNFGEVRGNHFHSGLDLKTGGKVGRPVYAIADGHVSRIAVSEEGFGKALYVDHPDGTTSVYAHLLTFAPELADLVKQEQYRKQSFRIDLNLSPQQFSVKKGELIAKSGNSGSSGGPHVHFELRRTEGQIPTNPLNAGFTVRDDRHPELSGFWIYAHGHASHIDGLVKEKHFPLNGMSDMYTITDTIGALGTISFGIAALDRFSSSNNVCGIYGMSIRVNGTEVHRQQLDEFPFSKKRMVNCHIDHEKRITRNQHVYRSYIAPGNRLEVYPTIVNRGMVQVRMGETYIMECSVWDHAGNTAGLKCVVKGQPPPKEVLASTEQPTDVFIPMQENSFANHSLRLHIPTGALYDTLKFHYDLKPPCDECISAVHSIGKLTDTPLDRYMTVSIRLDHVPAMAAGKAVVVSFDKKGEPVAEGGTVKWNWATCRTRSFGDYAVMLDTLAPVLKTLNFNDRTSTAGIDTLKFHLKDDLSGIGQYRGTLNGKWVLLEYDPKNDLLYHVKDERFRTGQNTFRIKVNDRVGNTQELNVTVQ